MLLGIDFENTIIKYDELFYRVAREKNLIPSGIVNEKIEIRNYLRANNREDEWTRMQGEVYGPRINEAVPFEFVIEALGCLKDAGIRMCLVSHKTKTPYLGKPFDIQQAALGWLENQGFFDHNKLNWSIDDVFFELTRKEKIARIISLGCTHFIDDLPGILCMLPRNIKKFLFSPKTLKTHENEWSVMDSWANIRLKIK